ncbi:hypothetical protein, partial [Hydrogenivirga sp. 128-5-R1-1]|uniref:hypothetical protein n=1 Tax=Hydrogenivirga sp. 128-5-R1-1 TaxID=392423 RepID=UPI00015F0D85
WDPLSVFIILVALYSVRIKNIYLFTGIISILQDIFTFGYGVNFFSKMFLVVIVSLIKEKFFISSFFIKSLIVIILTILELSLKTLYSFIFLGKFEFCIGYIFYAVLNFAVFYIYSLLKETSKKIE